MSADQAGAGADHEEDQMRAVLMDQTGSPEVLYPARLPVPVPGPGEVLIRTRAVGVNAIDWKSRAGGGLELELPAVLGWDVSGTVTALGPGVEAFAVDDEVFGLIRFPEPGRAYAEYVTAPSDQLVARPETIDPITAAAVPMCSVTAWKALFTHGQLQPGQRVLVHGAAGGVGHLAIQLAKQGGAAEVIGTGSAASHDFVIGLGADQVVDYTQVPLGSAGTDLDLVIDTRGGKDLIELLHVLRPGGTVVSLLGQEPDADRLAAERGLRIEYVYVSPDPQALAEVAKLLVTGELQVPVEKVLPLEQAAEAHAIGDAGHVRGRLVLNVS